jgi:hypothetical protein
MSIECRSASYFIKEPLRAVQREERVLRRTESSVRRIWDSGWLDLRGYCECCQTVADPIRAGQFCGSKGAGINLVSLEQT